MIFDVIIQEEDFETSHIFKNIEDNLENKVGAISTFTGYVKSLSENNKCKYLEIEHYPGMSLKCLSDVAYTAKEKFLLYDLVVIHRYGMLKCGNKIVFLLATSISRNDSFCAVEFIIERIKKDVPFWKREHRDNESVWVYT